MTRAPRRPRSRYVLASVLVGPALLVAAGVATRAELASVDGSLASARAELRQTVGRVATSRSELAGTAARSATVQHTLAADTALLGRDEAQLAHVEARTGSTTAAVADLHTCLAGVERALNEFALGDRTGAQSSLGAVGASCRDAGTTGA